MNGDFGDLVKRLEGYEKEILDIFRNYNPNDSELKLELTNMKLLVIFYNYSIDCFEALTETYKDKYFYYARKGLTALSYFLTAVSFFKARDMTLPSLVGCCLLTLKNQKLDKEKTNVDSDDINRLLDLLDNFEDDYAPRIDEISDQIDLLEDEDTISKLEEPEKSKRIACKKLIHFLRQDDPTLQIEGETFINHLNEIINNYLNTNNENFYDSLQQISEEYEQLELKLIKLNNKEDKLSKMFYFIG